MDQIRQQMQREVDFAKNPKEVFPENTGSIFSIISLFVTNTDIRFQFKPSIPGNRYLDCQKSKAYWILL